LGKKKLWKLRLVGDGVDDEEEGRKGRDVSFSK
jgi:hypothetical protein